MQAKSQVRLVISYLAEALYSVVHGETHGFWTFIPLAWLQLRLQALIVGFVVGCKPLVLG